jgi:hypothetical protein
MGKIYNKDLHNLCWRDYVKVDVDSCHEDHSHPGYDALFIGNSLEAFRKGLVVSICRVILLLPPPLLLLLFLPLLLLLLLLPLLLLTAIELSHGRSSPYTSIDKTNKNKYTKMKQYEKHSTHNTKHSIYKYPYYQNTHTLQNQHIHTPTH